jgi:DNA replicative helicase MCM subunit Mcm2 (Cdc46/Mcm family)
MAARDPAQQGAAIQRRAQGAQQNFAQQLRFELGVQERFLHFLETFEAPDDAQEEGAEGLRKKTYADKARKMAQRGKDLLEVRCVDALCKLRMMQADCAVHTRERNTVAIASLFLAQVDWADLEAFDARLSEEIQRQFYVLQDFLVAALRPFIRSIEPDYVVDDMGKDKVFQLAFKGVHPHVQLRDLKTIEIGKLISIVGTVTRTGDVRPELISGTFLCLECRAEIRNVLQQFK